MSSTDIARRGGMPPRVGAWAADLLEALPCGHDRACAPAYATAQGLWRRGQCRACSGAHGDGAE